MTAADIVEAMRQNTALAREVLSRVMVPQVRGFRGVWPSDRAPMAEVYRVEVPKADTWETYMELPSGGVQTIECATYGEAMDAAAEWLMTAGYVVLR